MSYAPFPLIEVAGRPYERGVAYGRAGTDRIKRSVRLYADDARSHLLARYEYSDVDFDVGLIDTAFDPNTYGM